LSVKQKEKPILEVKDLVAEFTTAAGRLRILDGIDFSLFPAEILALVGETGCGKSVTAKSIMNLLAEQVCKRRGKVMMDGVNLLDLSKKQMRSYLGRRISMIFQNPIASINPVFTLGEQIRRLVRIHMAGEITRVKSELGCTTAAAIDRLAAANLEKVGLTDVDQLMRAYAHQISGGMAQRYRIATAVLGNPDVLIADEATSALDVTVQAHILRLLKRLSAEKNTAIIFITHDLGIAAQLCQQVAVMYSGRIVEVAPTAELFKNPLHPYTRGLLKAVPQLSRKTGLEHIPGTIPDLRNPPSGCRFHPRCRQAMERCRRLRPPLVETKSHQVCCHLYDAGNKEAAWAKS